MKSSIENLLKIKPNNENNDIYYSNIKIGGQHLDKYHNQIIFIPQF